MSDNNEKRSHLIAEDLGEDAVAALANGTEWEWTPEDATWGDEWVEQGSNQKWTKFWLISGYSIANGKLTHDLHECDEDGEWDWLDGCDVDDPSYDEWYKASFSEDERQRGWQDYAAHVAKTGEDPIGNYLVERTHKEAWTAKLIQDERGVKFYGAHRQGLAFVDQVAEKDFNKLPKDVQQFLCVQYGLVGGFKSLDELKDDDFCYKLERGDGFAVITFDVEVEDDPEVVRRRLMEIAQEDDHEDPPPRSDPTLTP